MFEPGEDLFDQVQVRGVFRQEEHALPLLLTHGWSGSVLEFSKVIGPLTDLVAHGGKASDAFHVIVPSLPGFGFSDKPQSTGWPLTRTAKAWAELMKRLGYNRYVAQGGHLGAGVTTHMGRLKLEGLAAIHLNFPTLFPPPIEGKPDAKEKAALGQLMRFRDKESGYSQIQKTRPQTLGYGLTDSPIGQAAWIYEKCIELAGDGISYEDVLKPVAGILQCVVITTSPGRCPRPSIASISGGQPPSFASSQKAATRRCPTVSWRGTRNTRISGKTIFWVVRTPDTYSC